MESALKKTNAQGDDRNLHDNGYHRRYWYSIADGYRLLIAIRKGRKEGYGLKYLNEDGTNFLTKTPGEEYSSTRENVDAIFLTDPYYYKDNFVSSFENDIKTITGAHEGDQIGKNNPWSQMPQLIIIPLLSGGHWRAVRVQVDYKKKSANMLYDDPYGDIGFCDSLITEIELVLKAGITKIVSHQNNEVLENLNIQKRKKFTNQQGSSENYYDCGPIIFRNIEDYVTHYSLSNEEFLNRATESYQVSLASDSNHENQLRFIREEDIETYNRVAEISTSSIERINQIKQSLSHDLSQKKRNSDVAIDFSIINKINQLPTDICSVIFEIIDYQRITEGKGKNAGYTSEELTKAYALVVIDYEALCKGVILKDGYIEKIVFPSVGIEETPAVIGWGEWHDVPNLSVITGPNGSGKSHLLKYIYNELIKNHKSTDALYIEAGFSFRTLKNHEPTISKERIKVIAEKVFYCIVNNILSQDKRVNHILTVLKRTTEHGREEIRKFLHEINSNNYDSQKIIDRLREISHQGNKIAHLFMQYESSLKQRPVEKIKESLKAQANSIYGFFLNVPQLITITFIEDLIKGVFLFDPQFLALDFDYDSIMKLFFIPKERFKEDMGFDIVSIKTIVPYIVKLKILEQDVLSTDFIGLLESLNENQKIKMDIMRLWYEEALKEGLLNKYKEILSEEIHYDREIFYDEEQSYLSRGLNSGDFARVVDMLQTLYYLRKHLLTEEIFDNFIEDLLSREVKYTLYAYYDFCQAGGINYELHPFQEELLREYSNNYKDITLCLGHASQKREYRSHSWVNKGGILFDPKFISSGEFSIFQLLTLLNSFELKKPKVLILDEPDAHLDPKLCKKLIKIIREEFVEKYKIQVIMSTHKLDTIALVPSNQKYKIYTIEKEGKAIEVEETHPLLAMFRVSESLKDITGHHHVVYAESRDDALFYEGVYQTLMRHCDNLRDNKLLAKWQELDISFNYLLSKRFQLSFYSVSNKGDGGGGASRVIEYVASDIIAYNNLKESFDKPKKAVVNYRKDTGLFYNDFRLHGSYGIIDKDYGKIHDINLIHLAERRTDVPRIVILERHSLENYIFDPFIFSYLLQFGDILDKLNTNINSISEEQKLLKVSIKTTCEKLGEIMCKDVSPSRSVQEILNDYFRDLIKLLEMTQSEEISKYKECYPTDQPVKGVFLIADDDTLTEEFHYPHLFMELRGHNLGYALFGENLSKQVSYLAVQKIYREGLKYIPLDLAIKIFELNACVRYHVREVLKPGKKKTTWKEEVTGIKISSSERNEEKSALHSEKITKTKSCKITSEKFSDGTEIYSNGVVILSGGTKIHTRSKSDRIVFLPDGTKIFKDGEILIVGGITVTLGLEIIFSGIKFKGSMTLPDGREIREGKVLYQDGLTIYRNEVIFADGARILADRSIILADGRKIENCKLLAVPILTEDFSALSTDNVNRAGNNHIEGEVVRMQKDSGSNVDQSSPVIIISSLHQIYFDNPLLSIPNIILTLHKLVGVAGVNNFIDLGKDLDIAEQIVEAIEASSLEDVIALLFTKVDKQELSLEDIDGQLSINYAYLSPIFGLMFDQFELTSKFKQMVYFREISKFHSILQSYGLDPSIEYIKNPTHFKKVMLKLHPDKGGNTEDFIFAKNLQEKLNADLDIKEIIGKKIQTIKPFIYKVNMGFKVFDTALDTTRLICIPTTDNAKKVLIDSTYLYSMYSGINGITTIINGADIAYKVYKGEYSQALTQGLTTVGYMLIPAAISFVAIPYVGFIYGTTLTIYSGYGAITNAYSFYQEYYEENSGLRSITAYKNLYHILSNSSLQSIYDFAFTYKKYALKLINIQLEKEKTGFKQLSEAKGEFGEKLYDYIYAPMLEAKYDLLNKIIQGDLTATGAEALEAKHLQLTMANQSYDHCMEIRDLKEEKSDHYYCYNEEQQILDHIIIIGNTYVEKIDSL